MAVPFLRSSWDRFARSVSDAFRPPCFPFGARGRFGRAYTIVRLARLGCRGRSSRCYRPSRARCLACLRSWSRSAVVAAVAIAAAKMIAVIVVVVVGSVSGSPGRLGRGLDLVARALGLASVTCLLDGRPVSERCLVVLGFGHCACPSRGLLRVVLGLGEPCRAAQVRSGRSAVGSRLPVFLVAFPCGRDDVSVVRFGRSCRELLRFRAFVFSLIGTGLRLVFDVVSFSFLVPPLRAVRLVASFQRPCGRPCFGLLSDHPLVRSCHRGLSLGLGFGVFVGYPREFEDCVCGFLVPFRHEFGGEFFGFSRALMVSHRWWLVVVRVAGLAVSFRFGPASGVGRMVSAYAPRSPVLSALGSAWRWPCLSRGAGGILVIFPFLSTRFLLTFSFLWSVSGFRGLLSRFFFLVLGRVTRVRSTSGRSRVSVCARAGARACGCARSFVVAPAPALARALPGAGFRVVFARARGLGFSLYRQFR